MAPATILTVDDDLPSRELIVEILRAGGYRVWEAGDARTALAMVSGERPDLILMDLQLPGLDGLEAVRRLKADPAMRTIPIVAVTAFATHVDEEQALAAGCDAYLSKPINRYDLLAIVARFLERQQDT